MSSHSITTKHVVNFSSAWRPAPVDIIEKKPDEKCSHQFRVKLREAAAGFEQIRAAAFSKVDIKGQMESL
jgi:hypothetical protein